MKRGLVVTVVAIEALIAAGCALASGLFITFVTGYAQRSGNLHGGVPPTTAQEDAAARAAGLGAFAAMFAIVLVTELALTAAILLLVRRAKLRATASIALSPAKPKPLGVWFIAASFSYTVCAALTLAFWTQLLGSFSATDYVVLPVELVAGGLGLWLALRRRPAPLMAVLGCAVPLCVIAYFTIPPIGPSLLIWPVVLLLLLANDTVRAHFESASSSRPTAPAVDTPDNSA